MNRRGWERGETEGAKGRTNTRVRVRALGDRNCERKKKAAEGGETGRKECEERDVGAFQRRTRGTVAPARRIDEAIGVFPREDSIGLTSIQTARLVTRTIK